MTDKRNSGAHPDATDSPGGLPPEKVEDRPVVGQVRPEDYPDRGDTTLPGGQSESWDRDGQAGQVEGGETSAAGAQKSNKDLPRGG